MIDLTKAEQEFINYTSQYANVSEKIEYKIQHTKRVESLAKTIAEKLDLDEENIKLAMLIGLLHDIGRFEQIKRYDSYYDDKVDHADLGVEILFKDNIIRKFIEADQYDTIIYKAVKNHNKYQIENNLSKEEELHAKIIRDADKIDILNDVCNKTFSSIYNKEDISDQNFSDKTYENIMHKKLVDAKNMETDLDHWILKVGFIFDFNFKISLQMVKESGCIFKFIDRIQTNREDTNIKLQNVKKMITEYLA